MKVQLIMQAELKQFLLESGKHLPSGSDQLKAFGLFSKDLLIGAVALANPKDRYIRSCYTHELIGLWPSSVSSEAVSKLLEGVVSAGTIDFFVRKEAAGYEELSKKLSVRALATEEFVLEWRNQDVSFYTYKISSEDRPEYYIGRKTFRKSEITELDCLSDKYLGSGGSDFKDWMDSVDPNSIVKGDPRHSVNLGGVSTC